MNQPATRQQPRLRLRSINYPLYLGLALTILVVGVAIFGPMLAPHDPLKEYGLITIGDVIYGPPPIERPIPPFVDARFPLGTDGTMRDVLSTLLWAVRPTLIMCVVIMLTRLVVGVVLGILAGWFGGRVERAVDGLTSVLTAVPLLVFAVAVLLGWGLQQGLLGFVVALAVTGWCDTASVVKTRTQMIKRAPYIESARALGLHTGGILRRHVLPQLRPFVPVLMAFELSTVLLVVAELGYLGYYLGGGAVFEYSIGNFDRNFVLRSGTPELGQMLSNFFRNLYRTPWIALAAGITVFTMLAAFALLGEGLRRRLDVTRPRRARRLRLPDPVLDTLSLPRSRRIMGGMGAVTGALLVGFLVWSRVFAQPSQAEAVPATPTPLVVSNVSVPAAQLGAVDLEALVRQPGVVSEDFEVFQVVERVPDKFRNVPQATNVAYASLKQLGILQGRILILLYPDTAQRDQAYQALADAVLQEVPPENRPPLDDPEPVAGERSTDFGFSEPVATQEFDFFIEPQLIFARCNAVVHIRDVELAAVAQALDARLAPQVCQQDPVAAQASPTPSSSPPAVSSAPATAEQLTALNLDQFARQPGMVPDNYEVSQVSKQILDQFRDVPKPTNVANISLKRQGVVAGKIQLLLYSDAEQRNAAFDVLTGSTAQERQAVDPDPSELPSWALPPPESTTAVGEEAYITPVSDGTYTAGSVSSGTAYELAFVRCGAAVHMRVSEAGSDDPRTQAIALAQAIDAQLTPQVCG